MNGKLKNTYIFQIGDIIDARDVSMGCWFEAKIKKIEYGLDPAIQERLATPSTTKNTESSSSGIKTDCALPSEKAPGDPSWKLDFGKPDGFTYHIYLEE